VLPSFDAANGIVEDRLGDFYAFSATVQVIPLLDRSTFLWFFAFRTMLRGDLRCIFANVGR
jgi:hypothetical protein